MTEDLTIDVMGDLDGVELDSGGGAMPAGDYPLRIVKVEPRVSQFKPEGAATGWKKMSVEFSVANGDFEGRTLYSDFNWTAPRDEDGKIVPSENKMASLQADGLSADEALDKARSGSEKAEQIGKQQFKKLMNAAGYIDMKDTKPGDENLRRIEAGLAVPVPDDFDISMLERRLVMARTKSVTRSKQDGSERTYQEVKSVWDVDPSKVGDLGEEVPF